MRRRRRFCVLKRDIAGYDDDRNAAFAECLADRNLEDARHLLQDALRDRSASYQGSAGHTAFAIDASRIFEGNVSTHDAVVVESLRDAGAILIGKTNIPEFAFHYDSNNLVYGATLNPHDRSRSVGGRSESAR